MREKIAINGNPYQNVDEIELGDKASPAVFDGYVNEAGHTVRRPGILQFCVLNEPYGLSAPVDGLHWWNRAKKVLAVCGGRVWLIDSSGGVTALPGASLLTGSRVSFADAGLRGASVVMANGGRMVRTVEEAGTAYITDPDAFTEVTKVAFIDQYILALKKDSSIWQYSEVNDFLNYDGLDFYSAETRADDLVNIDARNDEIILPGTQTIEFWYNDGSPFVKIKGATIEQGIIAPNSFIFYNNMHHFLNQERKFCKIEGRQPKIISTPFDKTFASFSKVSDASSDIVTAGGRSFLVLSFPTEGRAFVWDGMTETWQGEWSYWESRRIIRRRWLGNCSCWCPDWGFTLIGDRRTGVLYRVGADLYDDAGDTIRVARRTGFIDHGLSSVRKRSIKITIKLKRGAGKTGSETEAPHLMMRFRDQGKSEWSNERLISLKAIGETDFLATIPRLGAYYARQYEFSISDKAPLIICEAEEDFDALGG